MVDGIWEKKPCKEVSNIHSIPIIVVYSVPKHRETLLWQQGQHTACLITLGIMQPRESYRAIIVARDPHTVSTQA